MFVSSMDRRVRLAPKATAQKGGTGIYRSGYNLPPVALPGMTPEVLKRFKSSSKVTSLMKKMKASTLAKTKAMSKSVPGRFYASAAAWAAAGAAHDALLSNRVVDENMEDFWNVADQIKSVVSTGAMYINPLVGALVQPLLEGITQLAAASAKSNAFEGTSSPLGNISKVDFEEYVKYLRELEAKNQGGVTFDQWKAWRTKQAEQEGGSCQIVTEEMLQGKTVEEYMAEKGISPATPIEAPKTTPLKPTEKEQEDIEEALKDVKWGGGM